MGTQLYRYTKRDIPLGERAVSRRQWEFRYPPDAQHAFRRYYVDDDRIEMMPDSFVGEGDGAMSRITDLPGYVLHAIYEIKPYDYKHSVMFVGDTFSKKEATIRAVNRALARMQVSPTRGLVTKTSVAEVVDQFESEIALGPEAIEGLGIARKIDRVLDRLRQSQEPEPCATALVKVPASRPRLVINCEGDWEP